MEEALDRLGHTPYHPLISVRAGKTILRSQNTDIEVDDMENEDGERLHQHLSSSTPDMHTIDKQEQRVHVATHSNFQYWFPYLVSVFLFFRSTSIPDG